MTKRLAHLRIVSSKKRFSCQGAVVCSVDQSGSTRVWWRVRCRECTLHASGDGSGIPNAAKSINCRLASSVSCVSGSVHETRAHAACSRRASTTNISVDTSSHWPQPCYIRGRLGASPMEAVRTANRPARFAELLPETIALKHSRPIRRDGAAARVLVSRPVFFYVFQGRACLSTEPPLELLQHGSASRGRLSCRPLPRTISVDKDDESWDVSVLRTEAHRGVACRGAGIRNALGVAGVESGL